MIISEQIKDLHGRLSVLESCLDIAGKRREVEDRQQQTLAPDFWGDPKAAEAFLKKSAALKAWITDFDKASGAVDDLDVLFEFAKESISGSDEEAVEKALSEFNEERRSDDEHSDTVLEEAVRIAADLAELKELK